MSNPAGHDLFRQGITLFKSGKYQEAAEIFHRVTEKDEYNHKAWNALGVALTKIGDRENAQLCFENAHQIDPDNPTYLKNLVNLTRKKKPIKNPVKKPKPVKKRPISDYILAVGGVLLFLVFFIVGIGLIFSPHSPEQPATSSIQTISPTPPATSIPTSIITPSQTYVTPIPTVIITPSVTYLTPVATNTPINPVVSNIPIPMIVRFLDVGQGDSILLQAGGKNMLIDAGPTNAGKTVVSDLKAAGVSSLDVVVATHPHEDHIGGMVEVLNNFPTHLYVDSGETHTTRTYIDVMSKLTADQTPYAEVRAGKKIPFATGIDVQVMGPSTLTGDLNNDAIVLKVTDGSHTFLFMGDTPDAPGDIKAQILKVAHHGSAVGTSSGFLSRVSPEVAVIEVGAGNDYGHPKPETLANLETAGVKVYRTDLDGTITISTQGSAYQVTTSKVASPTPMSTVITPIPVKTAQQVSAPVVSAKLTQVPSSPQVCDCSSNKYNCNGKGTPLPNGVTYQQCYDYCKSQGKGDVHGLDRDNDGSACE